MTKNNKCLHRALWLLFAFASYVFSMLMLSSHTSPIYENALGWDSAIFSLMGKGLCEGKTLYVDLFDHKGPVIFYINAIGHLIGGRTGIFAVQCVFGFVSIYFFFKIFALLTEERSWAGYIYGALVFFSVYSYFFFTFERGNLTEEYSLPFIIIPLYLMLKYAKSTDKAIQHPPLYALVYGVCFGILAFLRVNNAIGIVAGVLAVVIYLLIKKQYASVGKNLLFGVGGVLLVAVPISVAFLVRGSFREMINATFLHNLKYKSHSDLSKLKPEVVIAMFSALVLCVILVAVYFIVKRRFELCDGIICAALVSSVVMLCASNQYPHYFAVFVPVYFLVLSRYFTHGARILCAVLIIAASVISFMAAGQYYVDMYESHFEKEETKWLCDEVKTLTDIIPDSERDSLICYQITPYVYHYAEVLPAHRYFTLQKSWAKADPRILEEFYQWMEDTPPTWVVVSEWENDERMLCILSERYEHKDTGAGLRIYRLITE